MRTRICSGAWAFIAGQDSLDNTLVLQKLATLFGMERVMIGGGGVLN